MSRAQRIVSIEGVPGAGKSTIIEALRVDPRFDSVRTVTEDIDAWTSLTLHLDSDEQLSLFDLYNDERTRWSFAFQTMALATGIKTTLEAIDTGTDCLMTERSIETNKIFAKHRHKYGHINAIEWAIYKYVHNIMMSRLHLTPTMSIFLSVTPETAMKRIQIRNRKNEVLTSEDVAYLVECHEKWAHSTDSTVIIDANDLTVKDIVDRIHTIMMH
jgi:deoxyadenosine/deoxycytidine kinase